MSWRGVLRASRRSRSTQGNLGRTPSRPTSTSCGGWPTHWPHSSRSMNRRSAGVRLLPDGGRDAYRRGRDPSGYSTPSPSITPPPRHVKDARCRRDGPGAPAARRATITMQRDRRRAMVLPPQTGHLRGWCRSGATVTTGHRPAAANRRRLPDPLRGHGGNSSADDAASGRAGNERRPGPRRALAVGTGRSRAPRRGPRRPRPGAVGALGGSWHPPRRGRTARAPGKGGADQLPHAFEAKGLRQDQDLGLIAGHPPRAHQHDRDGGAAAAQGANERRPIHARHLPIADDRIDRLLRQRLQRLRPIGRFGNPEAVLGEDGGDQLGGSRAHHRPRGWSAGAGVAWGQAWGQRSFPLPGRTAAIPAPIPMHMACRAGACAGRGCVRWSARPPPGHRAAQTHACGPAQLAGQDGWREAGHRVSLSIAPRVAWSRRMRWRVICPVPLRRASLHLTRQAGVAQARPRPRQWQRA